MVTTDANLIEHGVKTEKRSYGDRRRFPFPAREDEQIAEIARRNFLFVGVVFRRALVDRCGDFDERIWGAEDYDLWTRFLISGTRAAFVNEPLGWYRLQRGQRQLRPPAVGASTSSCSRSTCPPCGRSGRGAGPATSTRSARSSRRRATASGPPPFFRHAVRRRGRRRCGDT